MFLKSRPSLPLRDDKARTDESSASAALLVWAKRYCNNIHHIIHLSHPLSLPLSVPPPSPPCCYRTDRSSIPALLQPGFLQLFPLHLREPLAPSVKRTHSAITAAVRGARRSGDASERGRDEAGAHGPFPPVNERSRSLDITGGKRRRRRGGIRGYSHGDGRRRRRWRSEAQEEESGAPGVLLEDLLLPAFVLGRFRVRGGEDVHRGGE